MVCLSFLSLSSVLNKATKNRITVDILLLDYYCYNKDGISEICIDFRFYRKSVPVFKILNDLLHRYHHRCHHPQHHPLHHLQYQ